MTTARKKSHNPLLELRQLGQSVWLDYLDRPLVTTGELARLIRDDGLAGMTSNPKTFDEAIEGSNAYDTDIARLSDSLDDPVEVYEALAVRDVQLAADVFRRSYEESEGQHGWVSLEVNPHLADDALKTVSEARRLHDRVNRPNVFIKVPATTAGLDAITELTATGINVNVTLLFGLERYREVVEAYLLGLEDAERAGRPIDGVVSVASFFLSRIDVLVDSMLTDIIRPTDDSGLVPLIRGEAAIASAKLAYEIHREIFGSERFGRLVERGARPQRLLWASTGTKTREYSDIKYVEPLIGPDTVTTMPRKTLDAYRAHGEPKVRLDQGIDQAHEAFEALERDGIDMDVVSARLEREGIEKFNEPFDRLMAKLETALRGHRTSGEHASP
jgi:transaldolase